MLSKDVVDYEPFVFVDMPFGKKTDLASGTEIDFDQIYESAIKPAVRDAGLEPLRGDEEELRMYSSLIYVCTTFIIRICSG